MRIAAFFRDLLHAFRLSWTTVRTKSWTAARHPHVTGEPQAVPHVDIGVILPVPMVQGERQSFMCVQAAEDIPRPGRSRCVTEPTRDNGYTVRLCGGPKMVRKYTQPLAEHYRTALEATNFVEPTGGTIPSNYGPIKAGQLFWIQQHGRATVNPADAPTEDDL